MPDHKHDIVCTDARGPSKNESEVLRIIELKTYFIVAFVHEQNFVTFI